MRTGGRSSRRVPHQESLRVVSASQDNFVDGYIRIVGGAKSESFGHSLNNGGSTECGTITEVEWSL